MSVTESLLRVFRVDQQLGGLTGRLTAAEKFLAEQLKQLGLLTSKKNTIASQLKTLQSQVLGFESEMKSLDERIEKLKSQMDSSSNHKQYQAFLTEVNTYKADRSGVETQALGLMTKVEELKNQIADLDKQIEEREKVKKVAEGDRQKKEAEIADRLSQLKTERVQLVGQVPERAMKTYIENVRSLGDEAMAPVHELDRRNHEYTCGSCQRALPVEKVATLMKPGSMEIVPCPSCRAILYIEKETAELFGKKGGGPSRSKKGKKSTEQEQEV